MLVIERCVAIIVAATINVAWGEVFLFYSIFIAFDASVYDFGVFRPFLKLQGRGSSFKLFVNVIIDVYA